MYREGLARFSTQKYDAADIENPYMHLTNTSLNKSSPNFNDEKVTVWSL